MDCPECGRLMGKERFGKRYEAIGIDVGETWDFVIFYIICHSCKTKFQTKIKPEDLRSVPV